MKKVDFILDEASALGHMECLDDAVDKLRAYGVCLYLIYQCLAQLKLCFPNNQDQTLLGNATLIFFGVNDWDSGEYVSKWIGDTTITVESGGSSSGNSNSWSFGGQPQSGGGTSDNASSSWQPQARRLIKPEEIIAESPRIAFTLAPGLPPMRTTLLRYYEEKWLWRRPGWIRRSVAACCTLIVSAALCAMVVGFAAALTLAVKDMPWARAVAPPEVLKWLDTFGRF